MYDGYLRVSALGERTPEEATALYRSQIEGWAERESVEIAEIVEDTDVSGGTPVAERGLERLIRRVEARESEGIITPSIDRFGRSLIEGCVALKRIGDAGGKLIGVTDGFDSSSPRSRLIFQFRSAIAEEERDRRAEGFDVATERAVADGVHPYQTPFGYVKDSERRLQVNEPAAALVRELFERRAAGANLGQLERWFEEAGAADLRTDRPGIPFGKSAIRKMLGSRVFLGELHLRRGRVVKDHHLAILTSAQWEAAQLIKGRFYPRSGVSTTASLRGLVYCGTCGGRCIVNTYGKTGKSRATYVCAARDCKAHAGIVAAKLDSYVSATLTDAAAAVPCDPHLAAAIEGDARYTDAMATVERKLKLHEEIRDSPTAQEALGMDPWLRQVKFTQEALDLARRELSEVRPPETATTSIPGPLTAEQIGEGLNRELFARYVDRVVLRPTGTRSRKNLPKASERASIYWVGADSPHTPVRG